MEFTPELAVKVSKILKNYNCFVEKGAFFKSFKVTDCQVIFTKGNLEILSSGRLALTTNLTVSTGYASYITFKKQGRIVNLLNVHGKSLPGHKMDTPTRLKQSKTIIDFLKAKSGPKVIGGDFNLMPDTKSIAMFENAGYRNLIKDFGVKNTRNKLSWRQFNNLQYFADFVFVSKEVKVNKFEVPYMEISDHLPQILDFEV